MRAPTARSLILDLLSTLAGGSMPVAALIEAGDLFGLRGGSLRVALARLLADGRIERDGRGRYRLGAASRPIESLVRSWRHLERRTRPWPGSWITVSLPAGGPRARRASSQRALRLLGFRGLAGSLQLRPANLREPLAETRATLLALGLEPEALSAELHDLDDGSRQRAVELWDRPALTQAYRDTQATLERSAGRLDALAPRDAMAESFLIGGQAIQQLVQDPLLPDEILPTRNRDALVSSLRDYDARGRACWADFLDRFEIRHRATPQDTRVAAGLDRLRA